MVNVPLFKKCIRFQGQKLVPFLNLAYVGSILPICKLYSHFLNQHKIPDYFIPNMPCLKQKTFHLSEGLVSNFLTEKMI
jgi:hypothetical protein